MSVNRGDVRRNRSAVSTSSVITRLSELDHELCSLLSTHRVLTTTQLVALSRRPERTIDYRLKRLHDAKLVGRTRPYLASGSAPFSWWLTRSGARMVEGTSPAPGKAEPNPLFIRHTTAIAGLYVALSELGEDSGLACVTWLRDEDAWEDWSPGIGRPSHLRPDAYVEIELHVDGRTAVAPAFVEIDFATMDQARLRAKVARHRDYVRDRAWRNRHPGAPVLLLLTASEQRVTRFLATVERDRPKLSLYEGRDPTRIDALVAACAAVTSPEEALCAPVWRASPSDAPMALSAILTANVRTYRQAVRASRALREEAQRHQRASAIERLREESDAIAKRLGGIGALAVGFVAGQVLRREEWAEANLDLLEATLDWWRMDRRSREPLVVHDGWVEQHRRFWTPQARELLSRREAIALRDPRLRALSARLAIGELLESWALDATATPVDGRALSAELAAEYDVRRRDATERTWRELSRPRRMLTSVADLDASYDQTHLVTCTACGIARHVPEDERGWEDPSRCPTCGGQLVPATSDPPPPPELEESLAIIRRVLAADASDWEASW